MSFSRPSSRRSGLSTAGRSVVGTVKRGASERNEDRRKVVREQKKAGLFKISEEIDFAQRPEAHDKFTMIKFCGTDFEFMGKKFTARDAALICGDINGGACSFVNPGLKKREHGIDEHGIVVIPNHMVPEHSDYRAMKNKALFLTFNQFIALQGRLAVYHILRALNFSEKETYKILADPKLPGFCVSERLYMGYYLPVEDVVSELQELGYNCYSTCNPGMTERLVLGDVVKHNVPGDFITHVSIAQFISAQPIHVMYRIKDIFVSKVAGVEGYHIKQREDAERQKNHPVHRVVRSIIGAAEKMLAPTRSLRKVEGGDLDLRILDSGIIEANGVAIAQAPTQYPFPTYTPVNGTQLPPQQQFYANPVMA